MDALSLIEKTMSLLRFDDCFTAKQEADMRINYDFLEYQERPVNSLKPIPDYTTRIPFVAVKEIEAQAKRVFF